MIINDKKYDRNALIFNLCLVFDASTNTTRYEVVVKKLAEYFRQLEVRLNLAEKVSLILIFKK